MQIKDTLNHAKVNCGVLLNIVIMFIHVSLCYCRPGDVLFGLFFFFNDTATTEIYTLSLHDALPISSTWCCSSPPSTMTMAMCCAIGGDRKSTRLNSSHGSISYAVFCLKKKKIE